MATRLIARTTGRTDRDVRHEVPVHHVDVNQVGAATFGGGDVASERCEVGGENRRRNLDRTRSHRLTSSEIASLASHAKAACRLLPDDGAWRHARVGLCSDDRDAEALTTKRIGGALTIDANDIGHDVGGRQLAAIEQD